MGRRKHLVSVPAVFGRPGLRRVARALVRQNFGLVVVHIPARRCGRRRRGRFRVRVRPRGHGWRGCVVFALGIGRWRAVCYRRILWCRGIVGLRGDASLRRKGCGLAQRLVHLSRAEAGARKGRNGGAGGGCLALLDAGSRVCRRLALFLRRASRDCSRAGRATTKHGFISNYFLKM